MADDGFETASDGDTELLQLVDDFEYQRNPDRIRKYKEADEKQKAACLAGLKAQIMVIAGNILFFITKENSKIFYSRLKNFSYLRTGDCPLVNIFKHNSYIITDISQVMEKFDGDDIKWNEIKWSDIKWKDIEKYSKRKGRWF